MLGIDPTTTTTFARLLSTALYTDGAVGARNNWKALRNRSRPTHIIVWHGNRAIMDVDMEDKTVAPLTGHEVAPNLMKNISAILRGAEVEQKFVPAMTGLQLK